MNFHNRVNGRVSAAIAWYSANLQGFQHTHGDGAGRQLGAPTADGKHTEVYSIIYGTNRPGGTSKVIADTNVQNRSADSTWQSWDGFDGSRGHRGHGCAAWPTIREISIPTRVAKIAAVDRHRREAAAVRNT